MKNIFAFILITLLAACSGGKTSENQPPETIESDLPSGQDVENQLLKEFVSELKPGKADWSLTSLYTDTVEFIAYDDNYDYPFVVVKGKNGKEVSLISDVFDEEVPGGSIVSVQWRIDTFYEAGEGDELYYSEKLTAIDILERAFSFKDLLAKFVKSFGEKDEPDQRYIHPRIDPEVTYNPGAACVLGSQPPELEFTYSSDLVISDQMPEGGFCEGYEGVEDGWYFKRIKKEDLPAYADYSTGDYMEVKPKLPEGLEIDNYYRVTVVQDEYHWGYFYFVQLDDRAYLWIMDLCDCSA